MGRTNNLVRVRTLAAAWLVGLLTACGGSADPQAPPSDASATIVPAQASAAQVLADAASGFVCAEGAVTCAQVVSTASADQASAVLTFGQPFRTGDMQGGQRLVARDSAGRDVPMQMDAVSTRADGSVRLAVLTVQLADLAAGETRLVNFFRTTDAPLAAAPPSLPADGLAVQATVYRAQLSRVVFGNRNGHSPGIAFAEGEQITLVLTQGSRTETYPLTVAPNMAGGGFVTLTQIAWAFFNQINDRSGGLFKAIKEGEGGGYENLWITTRDPGLGAFSVSVQYAGSAPTQVDEIRAYQAPQRFQATADEHKAALADAVTRQLKTHLLGPVAREHTVVLPLRNDQGQAHPQLTARVHTRLIDGGARARHDVVIENAWAYNPEPGNLTYALQAHLGGRLLIDEPAFTHYHHARWHRVLWQGPEVQARVRHHMPYAMASGVIWQYNLDLKIPESRLAQEATHLAAAQTGLMQPGLLTPYFGTTGGRAEIGPYPSWTALYLVTQDPRARASMLTHADLVGGVPIHYRDAATDQPLDLDRHPGVTVRFGGSSPQDALPAMADSTSIWSPDIAHQGSFSFVPYLLTGDVFHLDELMFWAAWNMNGYNPGYRGQGQGLLHSEQVRGQAWALRSLGETARALPDNHPMKGYFEKRLANNLAWYADTYRTGSASASPMGPLVNPYEGSTIGPWQNDFFGLVAAQLVQDGYEQARPIFEWVSRFNVGRFLQEADAGLCLAKAPAYYVTIVKTVNGQTVPIDRWRDLVELNWPGLVCQPGMAIDGYPDWGGGYAANARAMLAAAANAGHPQALQAYQTWVALTPRMDASFLQDPAWAVVPLRHGAPTSPALQGVAP